ncbi:PucR family transcriptional regulator [Streptomyces sp. RB6PN25]|uniref:PucR family transcriptional regulator n=1 Tax=Streptomyces humicola TaxID=2953240 RepID=A0ABT1Q265_9ACTN|nr:PucR family transcriptional regulator [Streptomyces humicola]MCQ4082850.1 PucR family transcriptional regulator [Streptomyces humicola]
MSDLAPPTPAIPLSSLLEREDLGLRQVAGPAAEAVALHWVHTSEMADPVPYLLGGELLLTAGVHVPSAAGSGAYLDHYVQRTVEAGAAALGFGLAPVHDTTPRALAVACERYGLPLLEVPPRTPFTAVARAVWQAMAEARHRELRRVADAQQALASAAARSEPVPAVLRQLARHLGARAVLLDADGHEVHAAGRRPSGEVADAMRQLAAVVRPSGGAAAPVSAADTVGETRLAAYALAGNASGAGLVLALASDHQDPADHAIAGVGSVLLSLLTGAYRGAGDAERIGALVRMLLGASAEEVAPLLTHAGSAEAHWTVVHARRVGGGRRGGHAPDPLAASALGAALGTALVDIFDPSAGTVRALLPGDREPGARPGWTLGASAPAPVRDLAAADAQAAGALRRAVAGRSALVRHPAHGAGIDALVDPGTAAACARARLAPLDGAPALVETLRTWLSLHGSWDRTAVALGVHRNTVRQRIGRAAAVLDADLDDPDVRADLWIALRHKSPGEPGDRVTHSSR